MTKVLFDLESGVPGVRLATKRDEGELFALLCLLHAENAPFTMNRDKVLLVFAMRLSARAGSSSSSTRARAWWRRWGCASPRIGTPTTSTCWSAGTLCIPTIVKSDYARKLLEQGKWAHEWFKSKGKLMPFFCGINSLQRTEAKIRMYARHMPLIGAYFMYGETPASGRAGAAGDGAYRGVYKRPVESIRGAVRPVVETVIRVSQRENVRSCAVRAAAHPQFRTARRLHSIRPPRLRRSCRRSTRTSSTARTRHHIRRSIRQCRGRWRR